MKKLIALLAAAALSALLLTATVLAGEPTPPLTPEPTATPTVEPTATPPAVTLADIEAQFGDLTRAEIEALGYVVQPVCVDASELPPPIQQALNLTPTAAMGFHAVNEDLFDDTVDPLEPENILLGPNDEVWGVEYEATADTEDPTVLGQQMTLLPGGHPGMEFDHYAIHVWFIDNPAGQFADFNLSVSCPAAQALPPTGSGGYLSGGDSQGLPMLPLLAALAGAALLAVGWPLRRRASR